MPDLFRTLHRAPDHIAAEVAEALERRALEPALQAMLGSYIGDIAMPAEATVLEIGCGTGPVCRRFAAVPGVARVIGVDPAAVLVERARELAAGDPRLTFEARDGRDTGLADDSVDVVVLHTLLSHVDDQPGILAEARRVLKPGGTLAVCDADFSKTSVAIHDADPLQACVEAWVAGNVTDRWLVPRLPGLLAEVGFEVTQFRGHQRADIAGISTAPAWIEHGARALAKRGTIGPELVDALVAEGQRRLAEGRFYAALPFASFVAVKA